MQNKADVACSRASVQVAYNRFLHAVFDWFGEEPPPISEREPLL